MESFFHTLKVELVHQRRWAARDEARLDLFTDIEGYSNRQPIHSSPGYITPEQTERNASYPPVREGGGGSDFRCVATRYDKPERNYASSLRLAAVIPSKADRA